MQGEAGVPMSQAVKDGPRLQIVIYTLRASRDELLKPLIPAGMEHSFNMPGNPEILLQVPLKNPVHEERVVHAQDGFVVRGEEHGSALLGEGSHKGENTFQGMKNTCIQVSEFLGSVTQAAGDGEHQYAV